MRIGRSLDESTLVGVVGQQRALDFLDPADVINCVHVPNPNWVVEEYFTWLVGAGASLQWPGGEVSMFCGTQLGDGWRHIQYRHQYSTPQHASSWEAIRFSASQALGYPSPSTWDDYMNWAVYDSITWPTSVITRPNQKVCFSAPFHIWVGNVVYSGWYANTVLSKSTYLVVTAYLSDSSFAPDCDGNGSPV